MFINQILTYKLFALWGYEITTQTVLVIGSILLLTLIVVYFTRALIRRRSFFQHFDIARRKRMLISITTIIWLISLTAIAKYIGLQLDYQIINTSIVVITPYHIITIVIVYFCILTCLLFIKGLFAISVHKGKFDVGTGNSFYQILRYLIWTISIVMLFEFIGFKVTIVLAGAGALLVGMGFGLQQIFNDWVSGILILFERHIKVNDVVEIDGDICKVVHIGLRTSVVITRENIEVIMPNSKFTSEKVINWSHSVAKIRFEIPVSVAYGSNTSLVEEILKQSAAQNDKIEKEPAPVVLLKDFGQSGLDFMLFFWTTEVFGIDPIKSQVRFAINKAFEQHKIEVPYSKHDIYIKQTVK